MEGLKCLHHISEVFSDKIINNCPDYFDYDNTGDVDGSIFIFCARLIVSREGAFFLQTTTTTTKPGSAALTPSDKGKTERGSDAPSLRFSFVGGEGAATRRRRL